MNAQMIPRDTVTEICANRDQAVGLFEEFFDAIDLAHSKLREAEAMAAQACGRAEWSLPYTHSPHNGRNAIEVEEFRRAVTPPNVEQHKRVARRLVDLRVWEYVIEHSDLMVLMDKTAKDQLRAQMAYIPEKVDRHSGQMINGEEIARGLPPVSEDTILGTLEQFAEDAEDIWRRGIAEAFSALDRRFRSHDGFKIGNRVVLTHAFGADSGGWSYYSNHKDTLLDIERVFLVLDGKSPKAAYAGIVGVIDAERGNGFYNPRQSTHRGTYFYVRIFKNGNAHLWFERKDLLAKVNRLLAEYYGAGLGWGKAEQEPEAETLFETAVERAPARDFGLFPTPDGLAEKVIEEAHLWSETPLAVLEPSAGTGQLSRRAAEYAAANCSPAYRERCAPPRVSVVEYQPSLSARLRESGLYARVMPGDFLAMEPNGHLYDRVIMNPPFDRLRDVDHVHHALKFLKPGGRLVAIMSASVEFSEAAKAVAFRAEIKQHGGRFSDLPSGSFREHGTNVNTVLLTVTTEGPGSS